ncbi:hypothetical protein ZHAS_00014573 [Anopheles sinensis]|uniref:Secreted protein n=1 Tax=Anopheles sinensis TaxID=74873 RepID=A0A084W8X1_ANOSI|nr:hypothetical protein ZHAS_00014573 [Anopheles sinensis]
MRVGRIAWNLFLVLESSVSTRKTHCPREGNSRPMTNDVIFLLEPPRFGLESDLEDLQTERKEMRGMRGIFSHPFRTGFSSWFAPKSWVDCARKKKRFFCDTIEGRPRVPFRYTRSMILDERDL